MACVILVGMMGSGKTTVGRKLAARLDVPFKDTDKMLGHLLGRPEHELFRFYGEEAYRQHETRLLRDLELEDAVISTGGGIVTREENWVELRRLGTTVFLDVDGGVLESRLRTAKKRRPLLEVPDWEGRLSQLLLKRRAQYEKADIHVRLGDEGLAEVVEIVLEELKPDDRQP
ncbi:MAG: shikimate kinase [Armatimonadetes bacterium]|nr:shikimate kinase [Armatimonadota bacterium]